MKFLKDHLQSFLQSDGMRWVPDCWVVNSYAEPGKFIDWHSDDAPLFDAVDKQSAIVSLSFGADGLFAFRCWCSFINSPSFVFGIWNHMVSTHLARAKTFPVTYFWNA